MPETTQQSQPHLSPLSTGTILDSSLSKAKESLEHGGFFVEARYFDEIARSKLFPISNSTPPEFPEWLASAWNLPENAASALDESILAAIHSLQHELRRRISNIRSSNEIQQFKVESFEDQGRAIKETLRKPFETVLNKAQMEFIWPELEKQFLANPWYYRFGENQMEFSFESDQDNRLVLKTRTLNTEGDHTSERTTPSWQLHPWLASILSEE